MDSEKAAEFLSSHRWGVLITVRRNGRPQLSNIGYTYADGVARVSVTEDRAKTRNARRDSRVSLHVTSDDFWKFVVADGTAELSAVTAEPGDPVGCELAEMYELIGGAPHPDWDEFNRAMVDERRLVLSLHIDHVYGQV